MIPILYDRYSQRSELGRLDDCISCTVTEEINGIFECEFQYPITGPFFLYMTEVGGMVRVSTGHSSGGLFDIYKYSAPINGIVTFFASHVSYRLMNTIVKGDWTATTPNDAFNKITANAVAGLDGFVLSNGDPWTGDSGTLSLKGYSNVRALMLDTGEEASSMRLAWRGEFVFTDFNVHFSEKRGTNTGVQIRYGKNMTNVVREKDSGNIVSEVYPYWHDTDKTTYVTAGAVRSPSVEVGQSPWTTPGVTYIPTPVRYDKQMTTPSGSRYVFRPALIRPAAIDFSDKFESAPTAAQLQSAAKTYMRKNSTWRFNDNITVDFLDLYGTPEYKDIQDLTDCELGDYVAVFYPELGISAKNVEIVSVTYDVLAERYTVMQLNTIRTTLAQTIIDFIGGKR